MRKLCLAAFVAALGLSNSGCIKQMIVDGTIEQTRNASSVIDSIGDYELARVAAQANLAQFEGFHKLSSDNTDALYLLTQAWTGYGFGFAEDDYEAATAAGNDDLAEYHKRRARMAFDRAVFYGNELLSHNAAGFDEARKNGASLKEWADKNFSGADDATNLFWAGYAWLARVDLERDDPAMVADIFIGKTLIERAVAIEPSTAHYNGFTALGAYHARAAVAEPQDGKKSFEDALEKTQRKDLLILVTYAHTYACVMADRPLYDKLLAEVVNAGDTDPDQRLENTIAKRKAHRYQQKPALEACGFDTSGKK